MTIRSPTTPQLNSRHCDLNHNKPPPSDHDNSRTMINFAIRIAILSVVPDIVEMRIYKPPTSIPSEPTPIAQVDYEDCPDTATPPDSTDNPPRALPPGLTRAIAFMCSKSDHPGHISAAAVVPFAAMNPMNTALDVPTAAAMNVLATAAAVGVQATTCTVGVLPTTGAVDVLATSRTVDVQITSPTVGMLSTTGTVGVLSAAAMSAAVSEGKTPAVADATVAVADDTYALVDATGAVVLIAINKAEYGHHHDTLDEMVLSVRSVFVVMLDVSQGKLLRDTGTRDRILAIIVDACRRKYLHCLGIHVDAQSDAEHMVPRTSKGRKSYKKTLNKFIVTAIRRELDIHELVTSGNPMPSLLAKALRDLSNRLMILIEPDSSPSGEGPPRLKYSVPSGIIVSNETICSIITAIEEFILKNGNLFNDYLLSLKPGVQGSDEFQSLRKLLGNMIYLSGAVWCAYYFLDIAPDDTDTGVDTWLDHIKVVAVNPPREALGSLATCNCDAGTLFPFETFQELLRGYLGEDFNLEELKIKEKQLYKSALGNFAKAWGLGDTTPETTCKMHAEVQIGYLIEASSLKAYSSSSTHDPTEICSSKKPCKLCHLFFRMPHMRYHIPESHGTLYCLYRIASAGKWPCSIGAGPATARMGTDFCNALDQTIYRELRQTSLQERNSPPPNNTISYSDDKRLSSSGKNKNKLHPIEEKPIVKKLKNTDGLSAPPDTSGDISPLRASSPVGSPPSTPATETSEIPVEAYRLRFDDSHLQDTFFPPVPRESQRLERATATAQCSDALLSTTVPGEPKKSPSPKNKIEAKI